jgi:putative acetyltransferase
MTIVVRRLRAGESRRYLEIVNAAIRGLATSHYSPSTIDGWIVPISDETLADLDRNDDNEIRLVAEVDGEPAGIGALVVERDELRACYVLPTTIRRGCGTALVREIERIARDYGRRYLRVAASLNAEPFYASLGYRVRERSDVILKNGHRMAAVWMERSL